MARTHAEQGAPARAPLTRERVLEAAIALADEGGSAGLTMRKLAQQLGVEAMSLYNHVANKEDLLDGMVDLVFAEIDLPAHGTDWKAALRQRAIGTRAALERHRWAIGLMESRSQPGTANLRHHDAVLGCLREAGFSIAMAAHAYSVLDSYIYGFTLNKQSLPFDTSEEVAELGRRYLRELLGTQYPYLAEMILEHAMKPGYDYAEEFAFGLDLILDGLERVRGTA
jgi:AcrR family transcriptional regulator